MKGFSAMRPRKSRWIQDDHIKFFTPARQSRENAGDVVGNESMVGCRQTVQPKILPAALQRFFREIHVHRLRADGCGRDRKRAGVSEAIQETLRPNLTDVTTV